MGIQENIQLFIPFAAAISGFLITLVYGMIFYHFREKVYLAGMLISLTATLFVLFEALCVNAGFTGRIELGRQLNRIEHIFVALFMFCVPFMVYHCTSRKTTGKTILRFICYGTAALFAIISAIAFIVPDFYLSVTEPAAMAHILKGNAAKGAPGFLYTVRDAVLMLTILYSTAYIAFQVFKFKERKLILVLIGLLVAIAGAVDDSLYIFFQKKYIFGQFHFSRATTGMMLMQTFILLSIILDFTKTQKALNRARQRIEMSETKYRTLSEGVRSAVFSLSERLVFLSGNEKAIQQFALQEGNMGKKSFFDIINMKNDRSTVRQNLVMEKFELLRTLKENIDFHVSVTDPRTLEPVEWEFHFSYLDTDPPEYIGEAYPKDTTGLVEFIDYERLQISIHNYISILDDITHRLTAALHRYMDHGSVLMLKMGLQEILMNSIEHGNLNISFEEKTRAQQEGRYLDFIRERQEDHRYSERKVSVDYLLSENKVQYKICDEGDGFDYTEIMKLVNDKENKKKLFHGRGILMTLAVFDTVQYNSKGNQILLVKHFE